MSLARGGLALGEVAHSYCRWVESIMIFQCELQLVACSGICNTHSKALELLVRQLDHQRVIIVSTNNDSWPRVKVDLYSHVLVFVEIRVDGSFYAVNGAE